MLAVIADIENFDRVIIGNISLINHMITIRRAIDSRQRQMGCLDPVVALAALGQIGFSSASFA